MGDRIISAKIVKVEKSNRTFRFYVELDTGQEFKTCAGAHQVNYLIGNSDMHHVPVILHMRGDEIARVDKVASGR